MPAQWWRSPPDTRTRSPVATDTAESSATISRAVAARKPVAAPEASDAARTQRMVAATSREHLAVDHHRQKQEREVKKRELVDLPSRLGAILCGQHANHPGQQNQAEYERGDEVDDAEGPEGDGKQRERDEDDVVPEHLHHRLAFSPNQGRHRNSRAAVVTLLEQRERPEVWRRPIEDDEKQGQRCEIQTSRHRRPPDERWKCSGCAADNDVLRRGSREPSWVDEDVKIESAECENRGEHVCESREKERRRSRQCYAK